MKIFKVVGPDGFVYCVTTATSKHDADAAQFKFYKAGKCKLDTGFIQVTGSVVSVLKGIAFMPDMGGFYEAIKIALNMNFHRYWQRVAGEPGSWGLKFYASNAGMTTDLLFHYGDTAIEVKDVEIETSVMDAALEIAKTRQDLSHFVTFLSHEQN